MQAALRIWSTCTAFARHPHFAVLRSPGLAGRYPKARRILLPEGDHAISDFALHVDAVLEFLDLF